MTQKTAAEALAAYDELYRNPRTGEYIIDGDEAQVAADLAGIVRELQENRPTAEAVRDAFIGKRHTQAAAGESWTSDAATLEQAQAALEAVAVWKAPELTVEGLQASIAQHSPQFLEAVASDVDVVIMSVLGFNAPQEAPFLWECLQYARLQGKTITMAAAE